MKKTVISNVILVKFGPVGQKMRNRHSAPPPGKLRLGTQRIMGKIFMQSCSTPKTESLSKISSDLKKLVSFYGNLKF